MTKKQTRQSVELKDVPQRCAIVEWVDGLYKLKTSNWNPMYLFCTLILYIVYLIVFLNKYCLTLLHSERPKLNIILAFLSAIGLNQ